MGLKDELYERERELESNKVNLLMSQIRPHFINSNLAVIRSLCYEDTDKAVEMIDHFSEYLRESMQQIDDMRLVTIADDGTGFDVSEEKFDGKNHVGIRNVKDRLYKTLQGHVIIKSNKGEGTRVAFHIPVAQNE